MVIFLSLVTQGQEKQLDTGWQETMDFIVERKDYIEELTIGGHSLEFTPIESIRIDSNHVYMAYDHTYETLKHDYVWKMRNVGELCVPLLYLQKAYGEGTDIYLSLVEDYGTHDNKQYLWSPSGNGYLYDPNSGRKKTDFIAFSVSDSEMSSRLRKAFRHLAYLATRTRRVEREASGNKN